MPRRTTKADRARAKHSLAAERRCGLDSGEGIASRARTLRQRREGRLTDTEAICAALTEAAAQIALGLGPALAHLGACTAAAGENLTLAYEAGLVGE